MIKRAILRTGPGTWTEYTEPERSWVVLEQDVSQEAVEGTLLDVESTVETERREAVGFLTYEASRAWALSTPMGTVPGAIPPLTFTIFREQHPWTAGAVEDHAVPGYTCGPWQSHLNAEEYDQKIAAIREYLRRGDTYQVNFTFPMSAPFSGSPLDFFIHLSTVQDGLYSAYLELDTGVTILSASPELFLERQGSHIHSLPMKGTLRRGANTHQDTARIAALQESPKERAENLMITDMIRNDLGRVAIPGTVGVPELFTVQRYPRILQMVSRVEAQSNVSLSELLRATFPCASITGAPKKRTMEIISELEETPRGIYTGSIGIVAPDTRLRLSVAIRTVVVEESLGRATFNVGSGIVWDSAAAGEYDECAGKAEILTTRHPRFSLLETMCFHVSHGVLFVPEHWQRLEQSLQYFQRPLPDGICTSSHLNDAVAREVARVASQMFGVEQDDVPEFWRVRMRVHGDGTWDLTTAPMETGFNWGTTPLQERTLAVMPHGVATESPWIFHKTTHREIYDSALRQFPSADDVILWNEAGEVTETCTASIVLQRGDGTLVTPPVSSGLLPGTFRAYLLRHQGDAPYMWTPGNKPILEEPVRREELEDVRRGSGALYLINSVRGWMRGVLPALLIGLLLLFSAPGSLEASPPTPPGDPGVLRYFWGVGCPFCEQAEPVISALEQRFPQITVERYELFQTREHHQLFRDQLQYYGLTSTGVPQFHIGEHSLVGFSPTIQEQLERIVARQAQHMPTSPTEELTHRGTLPFGLDRRENALPAAVMTVAIAFVDGFNPCSLWVLTLLLGLIVHTRSRRRVLLVGSLFLVTTAVIYGMFMVGLLNVFLIAGVSSPVRWIVAVLAIVLGLINVKDYAGLFAPFTLRIPQRFRPFITRGTQKIQRSTASPGGLAGVTVLFAAAVAIVELPCTAGFPVIWSQYVVETTAGGSIAYWGLLALYLLVYLLVEIIIIVVATATLGRVTFRESHARRIKLIGGALMISLGVHYAARPTAAHTLAGVGQIVAYAVLGAAGIALLALAVQRGRHS